MTQAEQVQELLRQKPYRSFNSPHLKPTPDLTFTPQKPMTQEESEEDKLIFEYEQVLQIQKSQRGY